MKRYRIGKPWPVVYSLVVLSLLFLVACGSATAPVETPAQQPAAGAEQPAAPAAAAPAQQPAAAAEQPAAPAAAAAAPAQQPVATPTTVAQAAVAVAGESMAGPKEAPSFESLLEAAHGLLR